MRLELLLVSDHTIAESNNTWHLNLSGAFSLEFIFLCWFMIISTFTITVFSYGPGYSYPSRISIIIAAVVDVMLSLSCLTLLLTAEMQRCKYQDICLPFGKNIGVGKIEPITGEYNYILYELILCLLLFEVIATMHVLKSYTLNYVFSHCFSSRFQVLFGGKDL